MGVTLTLIFIKCYAHVMNNLILQFLGLIRLIAVMLWTLAGAAGYSLRSQEAMRVTLAVIVAYGIGVVAANLWNTAAIKPLYMAVFGVLTVGSAILLLQTKNPITESKPD